MGRFYQAEAIYLDMVEKGQWSQKDPRDENIMALTAMLQKQSNFIAAFTVSSFSGVQQKSSTVLSSSPKWRPIPPWEFQREPGSSMMKKGNQTYYWCSYHYQDGMWVTHTPNSCKRREKFQMNIAFLLELRIL